MAVERVLTLVESFLVVTCGVSHPAPIPRTYSYKPGLLACQSNVPITCVDIALFRTSQASSNLALQILSSTFYILATACPCSLDGILITMVFHLSTKNMAHFLQHIYTGRDALHSYHPVSK